MKTLNLFGVSVLSIALLASGCHRKPSLTPIPPGGQPPSGETPPSPGPAIQPESPVQPSPLPNANNTIPETANRIFDSGHADREKFAADTVYFDFDRATIKSSEESKLQDVANFLKSNPSDGLQVEGNCDERGTEKYNLALGERRALAAREYLVNLGVRAEMIKTVTYGASKPVDPGHNEEAWHKNRRDDMVLFTP